MQAIRDKIIWLTGASSGIGEALAYELATRGAVLALTSRRTDALMLVRDKIISSGGRAYTFTGDVQSLSSMKALAQQIRADLGPLDILISNAGTHIPTNPAKFDSAEYKQIMDINYGGMLHSIESVLPEMITARSGYIVAIASLAGYRGLPLGGAYGASKAAMINFLESIRFQLKEFNIPVTIVNPGFVKTPLTDKNRFKMPFLIDAPRAARIICDGIEAGQKEITFPFPFNLILKVARILPFPIYAFLVERVWSKVPKD